MLFFIKNIFIEIIYYQIYNYFGDIIKEVIIMNYETLLELLEQYYSDIFYLKFQIRQVRIQEN